MKKNKKIAFFKTGFFSHTNKSVYNLLKKQFPYQEIVTIDLWEENIVNYKSFKNIFYAFYEYGFRMFYSKNNILKALIHNSYIFNLAKFNIQQQYGKEEFVFTFQTQSQFDMSIAKIPHFIYTDNTAKAAYLYSDFNMKKEFYSDEWIECEKSLYNNATMNFTMSNNITRSMIEEYGCKPSSVICAYVAPNASIPDIIRVSENRYKNPNILFVGKEWEPKGGHVLLQAFKEITVDYPNVKLTIVGCSPNIELENCDVIGRVPVSEVSKYFSNATIFCLPTRREAFGIVYLEAMAYSLPVVGSNIGAIPEFIFENENGFICDVDNVSCFKTKIIELIESPQKCKQFGKIGRDLYLTHYTWDNVGSIMKDNIMKAISK